MSTVGIVCEYNPFHKGHEYQINEALRACGADSVVCFMSGNFLQRGIPALADKYTRTSIALNCGVSAVFEIPFVYATSSARDYAFAAVTMMNMLGSIDYISFGAETDDLELLSYIAHLTVCEPESVSRDINRLTSSGISYGGARAAALKNYIYSHENGEGKRLSQSSVNHGYIPDILNRIDDIDTILSSPNNILAIEYLAALEKTGSSIKPVLIRRKYSDYNSTQADHDICSASAIKEMLKNGDISTIKRHVPVKCFEILQSIYGKLFPVFEDSLSFLLNSARLICHNYNVPDMDNDLANRLSKLDINMSFSETAMALKCKNYTLTHIQRALLHFAVQLPADSYKTFKDNGTIYYARLLGLKPGHRNVVSNMKRTAEIPIITRATEIHSKADFLGQEMFSYDTNSTLIYSNMLYRIYGNGIRDDFRQGTIIV